MSDSEDEAPEDAGAGAMSAYAVSFGSLSTRPRAPSAGVVFRLAVLGDLSGRANKGLLETGEALAKRKPIKVDVDSIDTVLARMKLELTLSLDGEDGVVTVPINSIDDFHPDQIVENVPLFENLRDLRRNLGSKAGFDRAAKEVLSWSGEEPLPPPPRKSKGMAVATDRKLSDFARLVGRGAPKASPDAEDAVEALIRRIVGPLVEPARDAKADQLIARVDEALSAAMRRVLHHPDFQTAEAIWRGVDFLTRRIETGAKMQIVLYDVSAEEIAADVAANEVLEKSGLFGMLVEQPALDAGQGAISAIIGLYGFELTPPHADLLGRIAKVAGAAGAPFIAAIAPDPLKTPPHDQNPLIRDAWRSLRTLKASAYLGLATPRFLLRMPYGKKSDPIDAFGFEEFTRQGGLSGMLWGHPALIAGLLLAETFAQQGKAMKLGGVMGVNDIPVYIYYDEDGDPVAFPCTDRLFGERQAAQVGIYGAMPLVALRGRPEVRLASFQSVKGVPLAGLWGHADLSVPPPPPPPAPPPPPPPPVVASAPAAPPPPVAAPVPSADDLDLDAMLASLSADLPPEPAPEPAPAPVVAAPPAVEAAPVPVSALPEAPPAVIATPEPVAEAPPASDPDVDLDALLASLNTEPPPPEPDETEPDLDALLASLQ